LIGTPGNYVIIGRTLQSVYDIEDYGWHFQQLSFTDFGSTIRTNLGDATGYEIPIPPWSTVGSYVIDVTLVMWVAVITAGGVFEIDLTTNSTGFATPSYQTGGIPTIGGDAGAAFTTSGGYPITGWWVIPANADTLNPRINAKRVNGVGALRSIPGYSRWMWHIHRQAGT